MRSGIPAVLFALVLTQSAFSQAAITYPEDWGKNLVGPGSGATIVSTSTMESTRYGAANLLDGNAVKGSPYCSWKFSSKSAHAIIKLAESARVGRFAFMNEERSSYQIKEVWMYVSDDGKKWEKVATCNLQKSGKVQSFEVDRPISTSYIKLEIKSTHNTSSYAIMEEFAAFGRAGLFYRGFTGTAKEDVVQMSNGDSLHGKLAIKGLKIETLYANFTFPRTAIASINISEKVPTFGSVILTNGDLVTGFMDGSQIEFTLSFGANVKLPMAKIARIGMRLSANAEEPAQHDGLVFDNGDLLKGKVKAKTLSLRTKGGSKSLNVAEILSIEFPTQKMPYVLITMRDEKTEHMGYLIEKEIEFSPDHGVPLRVDVDQLNAIRFEPKDQ